MPEAHNSTTVPKGTNLPEFKSPHPSPPLPYLFLVKVTKGILSLIRILVLWDTKLHMPIEVSENNRLFTSYK